jgi:prepilin-type N-terminal cleavage/methylation domain-containing protein
MTARAAAAFTLIEVLAALVLLGLLAAAVVPLQRTLLAGHARIDRCAAAQAALARELSQPGFRPTAGERPLAGGDSLVLRSEPLAMQPGATLLVGREWWRLSIREPGTAALLAQLVRVWPRAPAAPQAAR